MSKHLFLTIIAREWIWLLFSFTFTLILFSIIKNENILLYFVEHPQKTLKGFIFELYPIILAVRLTIFSIIYLYKKDKYE